MGAKSIRVDYSVDGVNWVKNAVNTILPKANEQDDYEGIKMASGFADVFVQNILIVIVNTYSDGVVSVMDRVKQHGTLMQTVTDSEVLTSHDSLALPLQDMLPMQMIIVIMVYWDGTKSVRFSKIMDVPDVMEIMPSADSI